MKCGCKSVITVQTMEDGGLAPPILNLGTVRLVRLMSRPTCSQKVWPISQNMQYKAECGPEVMYKINVDCICMYKTGSDVWSGSMDVDEERRRSSANFLKENI